MKFPEPKETLAQADAFGWRRVLIVTALPLEMAAVRSFTKHVSSCQARDGSFYELGHFAGTSSDWLVVVGESGAGNHPASQSVTHACSQFGPFELIVMVGVAATRKSDDSPIGSVVAAEHVYWPYVGKFQEGEFHNRPRDIPINRQLAGFVKKVARDEHWHERLTPPYGGISPEDPDYPKPFPPKARVAQIVSVESVSADVNSPLEKHITADYQDATALEMEGYGAMFAAFNEETPCVVVRGISDDRAGKDPALDKIHQPIAAAHGAAFAYEVIDLWGANRSPDARALVKPLAPAETPKVPEPALRAPNVQAQNGPSAEENAIVGASPTIAVLSFAGEATDFPPDKQQQLLEVVRRISGNPAIEIVGSQAGSFHLFVTAGLADVKALGSAKARMEFERDCSVDLIGVTTKEEFEAADTDADQLLKASAVVMDWPRILPDGTAIERPELARLLSFEHDEEGQTKAVLGDPGSGKTALLAALAHRLHAQEIPFLAIKADILNPETSTEADLQRDLGLSELPSRMLARLSYHGPVFLLIDQLDALAGYVDLRTGRLSVLLNLVRTLGNRHNIHIVVSARRFEYEHDTRLKTVRAESVVLDLPPWSTVLKILENNKIAAAGWPTDAQQVIRTPQSLATFLRLPDASKSEPFSNYQKMLERLWEEKILARENGSQVSQLAGRIAEDMAERETLWLARSRYENNLAELKILLAEQILTSPASSPGSIGFSHQTIFDHALARGFAQKEGGLSAFVAERTTSLFIRPKLWTALTYLRNVEPTTYEAELQAIWTLPNLRFHLRHMVIEFLGQQAAPTALEIEIFRDALKSGDRLTALRAMVGSLGWFSHFKNTEIVHAMMDKGDSDVAAGILARAGEFAAPEVLELIKKHWLSIQGFDLHAWHVLQDIRSWSADTLNAAAAILERTEVSPFTFDHTVSVVGAEQPEIAIALARIRLFAMLKRAQVEAEKLKQEQDLEEEDEKSPLGNYLRSPWKPIEQLVEQTEGWDSLEALAKSTPSKFLEAVWPWFREVCASIASFREEYGRELSFALQYALDFRFEVEDSNLNLPEATLLGSLRTAAEAFAAQDRDAFLKWVETSQSENAVPVQRLIAHAFASSPEKYATQALEFLLTDTRRFNLGSIEDYSATTKRLIERVSPFWTDEETTTFASAILAFAPKPGSDRDAKSRQSFYRIVEQTRYELLSAMPQHRLPSEAASLARQGERKFGDAKRGAIFSGVNWVGPSMSASAIALADDDDVLNAFKELPDATGWDNPKTWQKGGNVQLSRSFAEFAKSNSDRAIEIIRQFAPEVGTRAAGYAIDSMADSLDADRLLPLIKELEARGFASEEYRGDVARAVEKLINRKATIDDDTLAIFESWLTAPPAVVAEGDSDEDVDDVVDISDEKPEEKEERKADSLLWGMGGISILPHGNFPILEVIARIHLQRKTYAELIAILQSHLARPEQEKVWQALFRLFPYIHAEDKAALTGFFKGLFAKYPNLAVSREAIILFAHIHWTMPELVHDVLDGWRTNPSDFVQQAFGELATLVALMQPKLKWANDYVSGILASDPASPARTGAAFAAVHVWAEAEDRKRAPELICALCKDANEYTWRAIIDLFRVTEEIPADSDWVSVLRAIADELPNQSKFMSTFVVERLQTLLPHEAELVGRLSKGLVDKWKADLGDMRTSHAAIAPELVDIAITLHRLGPRTRVAGLEVFEQLLETNAYTARATLDEVDNRFRSGPVPNRRTLPRRAQRVRRRRPSRSSA